MADEESAAVEAETETAEDTTPEAPKRPKKLTKDLVTHEGKLAITVLGGDQGEMIFDPNELTVEIQDKFIPFGIGHKLGDSAAGRSGVEAETAINKVWEGLKNGDWSVRAPAQPKVAISDVAQNFDKLSDEEKAAAAPLLKSLGIDIPGLEDESV